jgi:hypothetical protein
VCTGLKWFVIVSSGSSYEHGNEPIDCITVEKFLGQLSDHQFLYKDSVPRSYILRETFWKKLAVKL